MHHGDPVAQRQHLVEVVGDQQHRRARIARRDQLLLHVGDRADVQAPGRLVRDDQPRRCAASRWPMPAPSAPGRGSASACCRPTARAPARRGRRRARRRPSRRCAHGPSPRRAGPRASARRPGCAGARRPRSPRPAGRPPRRPHAGPPECGPRRAAPAGPARAGRSRPISRDRAGDGAPRCRSAARPAPPGRCRRRPPRRRSRRPCSARRDVQQPIVPAARGAHVVEHADRVADRAGRPRAPCLRSHGRPSTAQAAPAWCRRRGPRPPACRRAAPRCGATRAAPRAACG